MARIVSLKVFLLCFVMLSSALVEEQQNQYTCGKDAVLLEASGNDPQCLQTWTLGNMVIATYNNNKKECLNSCAEVSSGKITLTKHDCTAGVTLTVECLDEEPVKESRHHFVGIGRNQAISAEAPNSATNDQRVCYVHTFLAFWVVWIVQ